MNYILLAIGGALGSITRFKLGELIGRKNTTRFPLGTFFINITGAFLLGIVSTLVSNKQILLLLADGFLGAYTTFSTFMYEGFNLIENRKLLNATIYIFSSLILGVLGYLLGYLLSSMILM